MVGLEALEELRQSVIMAVAPTGEIGDGIVDTRLLGKPEKWGGDKKEWRHWSADVRSWVGAVNKELREAMVIVQTRETPVDHANDLNPQQQALNTKLHFILNSLVKGGAKDTLLNCPEGNGLEVWRRFARRCEPQTAGHHRTRYMSIIDPKDLSELLNAGRPGGSIGLRSTRG